MVAAGIQTWLRNSFNITQFLGSGLILVLNGA